MADGNRFPQVREVRVGSRILVVVEDLSQPLPELKGAIVWFKPHNLNQTEIDQAVANFKQKGAVRVKVLASQVTDETLPQAARMSSPAPVQTIRGTVDQMIETLPDGIREGARGIIEECLSKNGI